MSDEDTQSSPVEDLKNRHRKEKKELKEKCLLLKKNAKCGNKQKQKEVQAEIESLEKAIIEKHDKQMDDLVNSLEKLVVPANEHNEELTVKPVEDDTTDNFYKEVKVSSKKQKQQARKEEAARRIQEAMTEDRVNASSSLRFIERESLSKALNNAGLNLIEIAPDGDCLYNAIADQLSRIHGFELITGHDMRKRAARYILDHRDDFTPFLTDEDGNSLDDMRFEEYCKKVQNSASDGGQWGGEPELMALTRSLQKRILVIQPEGRTVSFGDEFASTKPLTVVYQRHAYQLGEHYNSTAPKSLLNLHSVMGRRRKSSGRSTTSESSKDDLIERFEEEQRDEDVPKCMMTPQFNESGINAQSTPLSGGRFNPAAPSPREHETLLAGNLNQSNWIESTRSMFCSNEHIDGLPNTGSNRFMLFILVAVCAALFVIYFRPSSAMITFESNIPKFSRSFSLPIEDEQLLLHIGNKWLSENEGDPTEPIILTVAGKQSNPFVTGLLNIAAGSIGKSSLLPNEVSSITSRAELHKQVFSSDEKVIAITSVEKMPWDVPLVLHAIADHISLHRIDNIFIILAVDMATDSTASCDFQIERELSIRWNEAGGDHDNIPPILSRILSYTICI